MIVPMMKYTMLLYHEDKNVFMQKLMDLGLAQVVHREAEEDDEMERISQIIHETEEAIRRFKRRNITISTDYTVTDEFPSLARIAEMEKEQEQARQEAEALAMEIKLLEPWGDFDRQALNAIEKQTGLEFKFFEYPVRRFNEAWQRNYSLQMINTVNGNHYFIILRKPDEELPLAPLALPSASLDELRKQRDAFLSKVQELNTLLDQYAANLSNGLSYKLMEVKDQLALHLAQRSALPAAGHTINMVDAWCPLPKQTALEQFLDDEQIVFVKTSPTKEDVPPILLKNNRFSKLFEPIGALFALPRYSELDMTVFFAPFFLLFFGLCLGDFGYGVVILVGTTIAKLKASEETKPYLTLAQLLGLSTIAAGILSGTLFGVELAKVEAFKNMSALFLDYDKLFNLALVIGFVQIIFGISVQAYKLWIFQGAKFAMAKIGWILLLIALADVYVVELAPTVTRLLMWLALGLIILFGAPEKGWIKSMAIGVTDLYSITSVFGDLLSYIRLFALGVSSAILGIVVNSIALSAKGTPYIGYFLFLLVLVIGHSANLMLSSLSAFVHPMRLTFVEFYKNSGFQGGGKPFTPLARKTQQQSSTH
jgi:V/A-type H+/Na+-transporting ATPase subunit I